MEEPEETNCYCPGFLGFRVSLHYTQTSAAPLQRHGSEAVRRFALFFPLKTADCGMKVFPQATGTVCIFQAFFCNTGPVKSDRTNIVVEHRPTETAPLGRIRAVSTNSLRQQAGLHLFAIHACATSLYADQFLRSWPCFLRVAGEKFPATLVANTATTLRSHPIPLEINWTFQVQRATSTFSTFRCAICFFAPAWISGLLRMDWWVTPCATPCWPFHHVSGGVYFICTF